MYRFFAVLFVAPFLLLACGGETPSTEPSAAETSSETPAPTVAPLPEDAPRLVLFLVVDQMRADYLERFRPLLTGGLARLLDEGVVFENARHDHATTTTSPGHATLSTGRHPSGHGIIANWWIDREAGEEVYAVENEDEVITPERLLAPTFGDWLKEASPGSKVFTASGKDRAAVLTAGKEADAAFWYDKDNGHFITSEVYSKDPAAAYPWLEVFHQDLYPDALFGTLWEPLPEVASRGADFGLEPLDRGLFEDRFPHALGSARAAPGESFYDSLYDTPFVDEYLLRFAEALLDGEALGQGEATDFLGLSFSAVDTVGHDYGPDSPEILDTVLRLDRILGELFELVDERVGLENVVVSFSSDHGVTEVPELLASKGGEGHRFGAAEIACVQRAGKSLRDRFGAGRWVYPGPYLDRALAAERGIDPVELENVLRENLEACPGIARVYTRTELSTGFAEGDYAEGDYASFFVHSFHPERSPDVLVLLEPHVLTTTTITTHGSAYPYDTDVPWILRLPGVGPRRITEPARTVDVAPTLAAIIGLEAPEGLDGVDLSARID